jgi:hypothetical protein
MPTWTQDDLDAIGAADEILVAPRRTDGSMRPYTTIWVVPVGDELYVRSYRGRDGAWFRTASQSHEGRIRAGGVERDVRFADPGVADPGAIDDAYRRKYGRSISVDAMVAPEAAETTLRLVPR